MTKRMMRAIAVSLLTVGTLTSCNDVLDVDIQGQITDDLTRSPAGADGLRLGAYQTWAFRNGAVTGNLQTDISNYGQVLWSGMLTDEFVNRNTTGSAVVGIDRRDGVGTGDYDAGDGVRCGPAAGGRQAGGE